MSKKKISDDDFEEDFENSHDKLDSEYIEESEESEESDETSEIESIGGDEDIDIIIEISEETIEVVEVEKDDVVLSKHKVQGKHSLKYDSIFKGKKDEKLDEESGDQSNMYFNERFEADKSSFFYVESYDNEFYIRQKNVKEKVYNVLLSNTSMNFLNNRRKPSKADFNNYYHLLKVNLEDDGFTDIELFNELSVYFSDNLFNMFKLLDNKWRNLIIVELQDHIGKNNNSKEITNRNIYVGTELEFSHTDLLGEEKVYTGVVIDVDYDNSVFKIDSYENIYEVDLDSIVKILNNTKFKYNLNKLNNIDFL